MREATRQAATYAALSLAVVLALPALYLQVRPQWVALRGAERAFDTGDLPLAARLYRKAGELGFDLSPVLPRVGDAYIATGALDQALPVFSTLLERDPDNQTVRLKLAELLARDGRHAQALEQVDLALAVYPNWRTALYMRARILTFAGRFAEAIATYQTMLGAQP